MSSITAQFSDRVADQNQFMKHLPAVLLTVLLTTSLGCGAQERGDPHSVTRELLPNGVELLRYGNLPEVTPTPLAHDLEIGVTEGAEHYMFGDIRGIEADGEGTIYILDFQAAELRAFHPDGQFARIVAPRGNGPGELSQANGMVLVGDSVLWIQDHGKRRMLAISLEGQELATQTMPVMAYGYIWNGTVDNAGRIWKPHSISPKPRSSLPDEGLNTTDLDQMLISFDPASGIRDTLQLGQVVHRGFVQKFEGGFSSFSIPGDPSTITRVDPQGGVWHARDTAYRITRIGLSGDTVMVIEAPFVPDAVTDADRREYVRAVVDRNRTRPEVAEIIAALMPASRPVLSSLVVDDVGRLWVGRHSDVDQLPIYDLFDRRGVFLNSVQLDYSPVPYLPIRIRNNQIYGLRVDSLGTPVVVRTPLLPLRDQRSS